MYDLPACFMLSGPCISACFVVLRPVRLRLYSFIHSFDADGTRVHGMCRRARPTPPTQYIQLMRDLPC